jgi:hypothetical protein
MSTRSSTRRTGISFPKYQSVVERFGHPAQHKSYMSARFEASCDLYRTHFRGHYGCVNAIEFSNNGGEFIVSGKQSNAHLSFLFCLHSADYSLYLDDKTPKRKHSIQAIIIIDDLYVLNFGVFLECLLIEVQSMRLALNGYRSRI